MNGIITNLKSCVVVQYEYGEWKEAYYIPKDKKLELDCMSWTLHAS